MQLKQESVGGGGSSVGVVLIKFMRKFINLWHLKCLWAMYFSMLILRSSYKYVLIIVKYSNTISLSPFVQKRDEN